MEAEKPRVVLLDDGELDDVRALLRDLEVPHCDARNAAVGESVPVLFSTPESATALQAGRAEAPPSRLHVVVGDATDAPIDLPALQLRRPLDPAAVRLLTRHEGGQLESVRRLTSRAVLGIPVKVRIGDERREVIVANLSVGGCGLVSPARLPEGASVEIALSPDIDARPDLVLTGLVRSCREITTADGRNWDASITFDAVDMVDRITLRALMVRNAIDEAPDMGASDRVERSPRDRPRRPNVAERANTRRRFRQRVIGVRGGVSHVLMGRDLSHEGIRVDPNTAVQLGEDYALAIFDAQDDVPMLVHATVARVDDLHGSFLRFAAISPDASQRIEALIDARVPVEPDAPDA